MKREYQFFFHSTEDDWKDGSVNLMFDTVISIPDDTVFTISKEGEVFSQVGENDWAIIEDVTNYFSYREFNRVYVVMSIDTGHQSIAIKLQEYWAYDDGNGKREWISQDIFDQKPFNE